MYDFYVWVSFFANEYFEMVSAIPAIVWLSSQVWLSRVKSNLEKTSIRVTQVHGSMQAQDVATKVKEIKEEKEKELAREAAKKKRKMIYLRHLTSAEMNVIVNRKDVWP